MSSRKNIGQLTSASLEYSQEYAKNSWEYYKLKLFLHTAELSTNVVNFGIWAILGIAMLLMFSISLALFLGETLNSLALGFLIVGFIYSIVLVIMIMLRNRIERQVVKRLSKTIFEDE